MNKNLGILSFIVVTVGIIICFLVDSSILDKQNYVFSEFGVMKKTSLIFNLTLIIGGFINLLYSEYLRKNLKLKISNYISILLYISSISLIGVGLIPFNLNGVIHYILAGVLFFIMPLAYFFVGRILKDKTIQILCLLNIILVLISFNFIKPDIVSEVIFALFILITLVFLWIKALETN